MAERRASGRSRSSGQAEARESADVDAAVEDEVRFHLESRVDELVAAGASAEAARARALAEFGDVAAVGERLRAIDRRMWRRRGRAVWWSGVLGDLRFGGRRLLRELGFTLPVVATLALGIGAAAAVFAVLASVVLRPLPYVGSERLVRLSSPVPGLGAGERWGLAKGEFVYFTRESRSFDALGLYNVGTAILSVPGMGGQAERTGVAVVSAGVARVLGVRPVLGRMLVPEDNLTEEPAVALIAHGLWVRAFGGDPGVLGRTVLLQGRPVRIVGVLPADARMPEELEGGGAPIGLWVPIELDPAARAENHHVFQVIGRLRAGTTVAGARADLAGLTARLPAALPSAYSQSFMERFGFSTAVTPLREDVLGGVGRVLWILFASVGLVLVIAAANVGNLVLVRAESRRRDTAVRMALGAGRRDLARQSLAESMLLVAVSGLAGLGLAHVAIRVLLALGPTGLPRLGEVGAGWPATGFVAVVSLIAGVLFGMLPLARGGGLAVLLETGRGLTPDRRRHAARRALVVAQVALSLLLLAGAALLLRSFRNLSGVSSGLDARGVLTFAVQLPDAEYATDAAVAAFYHDLADGLEALPGVERVGGTSALPLTGAWGCSAVGFRGAETSDERPPCVPFFAVAPGYFEALGIPVRGAVPTWSDVERGERVAVVSRSFAHRFWPARDAIGGELLPSSRTDVRRVIGVAGDVRANGLDAPPIDAVYLPVLPAAPNAMGPAPRSFTFVVRTSLEDPEALTPAVRRVVAELGPRVPLTDVRSMRRVVAASIARVSHTALLLALASAMALLLSAVGIYGVISYVVTQRRGEIGIRMALGAPRAQVRRRVLLESVALAAAGVVIGLVVTIPAMRILRSLLVGVSPTDPPTLLAASVLLVLLAAAASYGPARRAMRVDPVDALRSE